MDEQATKLLNDPDWLKERYQAEGLSIIQIAKLLGCSVAPVRLRLWRLGIPIRQSGAQALLHPRAWTEDQRRELSERRRGARNPMAGKPNLGKRGPNYHPDLRERQARATRAMKYGITGVEFDRLLDQQDGTCAICGSGQSIGRNGRIFPLAIDHDHKTGQVRGLLCHQCNIILGMARDDVTVLRSAIRYLETERSTWPAMSKVPYQTLVAEEAYQAPIVRDKTHCARGHGLTPENTLYRGDLKVCRECKRIREGSVKRHYVNRCTNGHLWEPETTYINPKGRKVCKICKRLRWRRDHPIRRRGSTIDL